MISARIACLSFVFFTISTASALALADAPQSLEQLDLAGIRAQPIGAIEFQRPRAGTPTVHAQNLFNELVAQEAKLGVLPQHRSKIYLHDRVTARSAVLIAGLYDSPKFMQGLAQSLHAEGMNVLSLRLTGHGTGRVKDLLDVRFREWLADADSGLKIAMMLGERVTFMGHSTGGALAAVSACLSPSSVQNLVLLAPALELARGTKLAVQAASRLNFTSDQACSNPDDGGAGCVAMNFLNPVFQSQLREKLPVVPAAGREVGRLANYAQIVCDREYGQIRQPVMMISTANDDVVSHDFNDSVSRKNHWRRLIFEKNSGVGHVNLPKSAIDEFSKDPRSHNPYFDSMLGHILDFISSTDSPQSAQRAQ